MLNVILRANETRHISWFETCTCKCRLDVNVCSYKHPFLCVCGIPYNVVKSIFKWFFTQFFNTILFFYKIFLV